MATLIVNKDGLLCIPSLSSVVRAADSCGRLGGGLPSPFSLGSRVT